jgi:hypothetical protein
MITFNEFVDRKQHEALAAFLIENGLNVHDFCETVYTLACADQLTEANLINELGLRNMLGGLSNLAANVAGLGGIGRAAGNAVGNKIGQGANAVGNAASAMGNKAMAGVNQGMNAASAMGNRAMGAVGQGLNAAKTGIGNAASAVGNTVGNAAAAVGNKASAIGTNMKNNFAQGKNTEQLKQASNAVMALQKQLAALGYPPEFLTRALTPISQTLQHDMQANQGTAGHKLGGNVYQNDQGRWKLGQKPAAPAAPAAAPMPQQQTA